MVTGLAAMTTAELREANGLSDDRINVGQKLKLPTGAAKQPAAAEQPAPTTPELNLDSEPVGEASEQSNSVSSGSAPSGRRTLVSLSQIVLPVSVGSASPTIDSPT